ncbi:ABC transporter permease [Dongia sp.]|uniref:ABC transporter permease n=1 Tax=Dongia sp. TaxID=1977262 RepID=UPI0035B121CE
MGDFRYWLSEHKGTLLAVLVFVIMFGVYTGNHSAGFSGMVVMTAANKGVLLALVAMAQTLVVLTAGIDLSVGMVFVLANCLASTIVVGSTGEAILGMAGVLLAGALCGALNGIIVIYGRLQPIVTTLATGAMFYGIALWLRPVPGGDVNADIADFLTGQWPMLGPVPIPTSLLVLLALVLLVWVPLRRSEVGRAIYAIGSAEAAAYMSGVAIDRARLTAYVVSGLLSAAGGLILTFVTYSGEASASIGGSYTLNSIAAVVIGGVSLFGGSGSAIGAIFGAFVLRTIGDLLFVFDFDPLWQPLFQGVILLAAVTLGSLRLLRLKNRLDLFG